jgi:hypothetical protein
MKGMQRRQQGRTALDLLEEATHLLRTAPVATLAVYYLGAIPRSRLCWACSFSGRT